MEIRMAKAEDLDSITKIFRNAIKALSDNNINQWDELYPNRDILEHDILKEQMYVGVKHDAIVSVVVINDEYDEEYKNGNWEYEGERFAVIHRLCVNPAFQNQKIGKETMIMIEQLLREGGTESIRLDSFSLNPYSLKLYESLGYKRVGEMKWRKGLLYLFEKKLLT